MERFAVSSWNAKVDFCEETELDSSSWIKDRDNALFAAAVVCLVFFSFSWLFLTICCPKLTAVSTDRSESSTELGRVIPDLDLEADVERCIWLNLDLCRAASD